jgi:hypothetical protein
MEHRPFLAVILLAGASAALLDRPAAAQEPPVRLSVYGGTCTVLIIDDVPTPKPCIGTLMVNAFAGGQKAILFHDADDQVIAFQAVPRQGQHFAVTSVERNGQSDAASGACTIDLTAQHTGEIRCEAKAAGRLTSGTFEVTQLKHELGGQ